MEGEIGRIGVNVVATTMVHAHAANFSAAATAIAVSGAEGAGDGGGTNNRLQRSRLTCECAERHN